MIGGPALSIRGICRKTRGTSVASVLLVEDDEQVRVLAESILRDAGYMVVTATGIDGSQALLDGEKPVDVLFVDITLGNDPQSGLRIVPQSDVDEQDIDGLFPVQKRLAAVDPCGRDNHI